MKLDEVFKNAIYYDNRGYSAEAKQYYDQLYVNRELLNLEMIERLSIFYISIQKYGESYFLSKLGISLSGELRVFLPLFFSCWKYGEQSFDDLEWLLNQPGIEHLLMEIIQISELYISLDQYEKAYYVLLGIAGKVDIEFRDNTGFLESYINYLLLLIELEYHFKNFNQARFHLRKLIYLRNIEMSKIQQITYWALILDEIVNLVGRNDWYEISDPIVGEVKLLATFYKDLLQNSLNTAVASGIEFSHFEDLLLEVKRKGSLQIIWRLRKDQKWLEHIEVDYLAYPNDLTLGILYANYLEDTHPELLKKHLEELYIKHSDKREVISAYWRILGKAGTNKEVSPNESCKVTFLGGGEKIGGTSILINVNGHLLLLDAGMHLHEENYHADYTPMFEQGITFDKLDALLITHAHLDHTGSVPYIYKQSNQLPIYTTEATRRLMRILLLDAVKGNKKHPDSYSEDDVRGAILNVRTIEQGRSFVIPSHDTEWKVTYYHSGHILGASSIHLEIDGVSILFTGDYSIDNQKTVEGLKLPSDLDIDILITESTYGFMPTNASISRDLQEMMFTESIKKTINNKGNILIPAFAVGRAQEILMIIRDAFQKERFLPFNLFIDGRVIDVCKVYQDIFDEEKNDKTLFGEEVISAKDIYANQKLNSSFDEFYDDYISRGGNCIVASSGMLMDQSASARYAEKMIEESRNTISFTGYMDEESPGNHLLQMDNRLEDQKVKINGVTKNLNATIETFRLSAHASREQILKLIMDVSPKQVFLMHGEHQRSYIANQTLVGGETIYPTLINLLTYLEKDMSIIPAFNGQTYLLITD
ncbi:MBL fold metallo-hydrolase [Paenibacillus odorifer]|uniref:MBL fold metallo-hydrolase n=1 Tax=Paenibacillus odorifer TaxID=189426 RepID=UPI00096FC2FC|nr:MBL fold metallo-hydrolase [Paenibacillus odorifer]OME19924.1 hypothetical protein BSK57_23435 [Paenibacillus odorifer]